MNSSRGQQASVQQSGNVPFTPPPRYYPGFQTAVRETTAPPAPPNTGGVSNNDIAKFLVFEVAPFFVPGGAFVKGAQAGARILGALTGLGNTAKAMTTAARMGHAAHHLAHGAHVAHAAHSLAHALSSDSAAPSGQPASPGMYVYVPSRGGMVHVEELAPKNTQFTPPPPPTQIPMGFQTVAPATTVAVPRQQVVRPYSPLLFMRR
jgi:hypothetical protein